MRYLMSNTFNTCILNVYDFQIHFIDVFFKQDWADFF